MYTPMNTEQQDSYQDMLTVLGIIGVLVLIAILTTMAILSYRSKGW